MSLASGTRLGPYEIQSAIGAGGMGEVYKARDTRLDRTVAIKVLPPDVSGDPERRARFEREAKTVAGLNHAHICVLHDVGDHEGQMFLVMEHLAGLTLADRLAKGPLPLAQALTIATEIADALTAAHRQGVVHRDLKPANVMLTKGGAKLLDFGLAKLIGHGEQPAAAYGVSDVPTQAATLTGQGVIVGTLQYMAPEQLEGKSPDARTDLWALGAILYEMVTGMRAFEGTSVVSLMAAIMDQQPPPIATLQPLAPPALDRLVRKCLQKGPDLRWQTAADLTDELRWIGQRDDATAATATSRSRRVPVVLVVLVLGLAMGAVAGWRMHVQPAPRTSRLSISVADEGLTLTLGGVAISPDGRTIVFAARQGADVSRLYVRRLDGWRSRPLDGTESAVAPMFSPDGNWVAFTSGGALKKSQLVGGKPERVCSVSYQGASRGAWAADGTIITSQWPGLPVRVSPGGTPQPVAALPAGVYYWPHLLPDGKSLLATRKGQGQPRVVALEGDREVREVLQPGATCARYVPTGHLLYETDGRLRAVAFDPARLQARGDSREVIDDLAVGVVPGSAAGFDYDVSAAGHVAYLSASTPLRRLVWKDRTGRASPAGFGSRCYGFPSLSPDGRELVVTVYEGLRYNVWVGRVGSGLLEPRTTDGASSCPVFSPDGRWLYYASAAGSTSDAANLVRARRDSDRPQEALFVTPAFRKPTSLSKEGILLFNELDGKGGRRISEMAVDRRDVSATFGNPSGQENEGMFSPDGRWVAYQSDETGRWEVYIRPYPAAGVRGRRVSIDGGMGPAWNPRGGELFFQTPTALMSVAVEDGIPTSAPRQLFAMEKSEDHRREFDVAPDGERFLVMEPASPRTEIKIILNWFEELKAKVPPAR